MYGLAELSDWALSSSAMEKYQQRMLIIRHRLLELDTDNVTQSANEQFQYLFNTIYYPKFWSLQRALRASVSSLLSILIIYNVFGLIMADVELGNPGGVAVIIGINLVADYISLQETSWVLQWSQRSRILGLMLWAALDLLLTTLIYLVTLLIGTGGLAIYTGIDEPSNHFMVACFLSTFVTSFLWFGFFVTALAIRILKRGSPIFRAVLQAIGESKRPGRTTAGIITLSIVLIYGLIEAISWLAT